jgi:GT2 family glycosyltransferase
MSTDQQDFTFHLVISTNRPPEFLETCIAAIRRSRESVFITVVDQAPTPRCEPVIRDRVAAGTAEYVHSPDVRGLSRGRNRGMARLRGAVIAFPDDDCVYGEDVLESVRTMLLSDDRAPDGVSIRLTTPEGADTMLRWSHDREQISPSRVPYTVCSSGIFLRASTVRSTGWFDETLGTGSGTPFGAGEETDYVLRALEGGAVIAYEPSLTVVHGEWRDDADRDAVLAKVLRYNRGFGRVMRLHRQRRDFAYWTVRSAAGVVVRALQGDRDGCRRQFAQLRGRLAGWFARP